VPSSQRLLVVDDSPDGAETLATALRLRGYDVRTAADGPQALSLAAEFQPQIALLDIRLPAMDGYELAGRLRDRLGPDLKLIALTGYGEDEDRMRSRAAGFSDHLVKPVSLHVLMERLAALT
jgi:CheY-like chemotaxis protein